MGTFEAARDAFTQAMDESIELYERSGDPVILAELMRRLGELIDIMESEIVRPTNPIPQNAREIVDHLRTRLNALEPPTIPPHR